MKLYYTLPFCLLGSALAASSESAVYSSDYCSWSPLQPSHEMSCQRLGRTGLRIPGTNQTSNRHVKSDKAQKLPVSDTWKGPHMCAEQYCVWSNAGFAGQGISIATTIANKQLVADLPVVTVKADATSHFHAVAIPGKGLGFRAKRLIRRGEQILAARPAMFIHRKLIDDLDLEDQYALFETSVANLPEDQRESFMAQTGELGGHQIMDKMFTNSFQMSLGSVDTEHFGSFPEVSRFNHDCRPK